MQYLLIVAAYNAAQLSLLAPFVLNEEWGPWGWSLSDRSGSKNVHKKNKPTKNHSKEPSGTVFLKWNKILNFWALSHPQVEQKSF